MRYESTIHQFLYVYRFFTFAIAVVLTQVIPLIMGKTPVFQTYSILIMLGLYTLLKVLSPIRWRQKEPLTYVILGGDLLLCILLVLYTGGLNSGFLLYSLIPVITAALLFEERIGLFVAALSSLSLFIAHTGLSQFSQKFVWVMQDNNLPFLIMYSITCFLISTLTYRTNLNIRQYIQRDAILDERRSIRREIHDNVAQTMGYLNMKTKLIGNLLSSHNEEQALKGLDDITKMVKDTYEDIRESIDQLDADIRVSPLIPTLSGYIREFSEQNNIKIYFDAPKELPGLSPIAELQLLRIAQEALTNVRRHSKASLVWLELAADGQEVQMIVRDNGHGMPSWQQDDKDNSRGHRGLAIMKERAGSLGGTLKISSAGEKGTEIRVVFPGDKVRL